MSNNGLYKVNCGGVTAIADTVITTPDNDNTFILMNVYGSESQIRGIFSVLVSGKQLTVSNKDESFTMSRRYYSSSMKFKSWKFGYGKYQALIRDDHIISDCVLVLDDEVVAWEKFLRKKRIPFVKEWIPEMTRLLQNEGLITALVTSGFIKKAWEWKASDDEVCNLIVEHIFKENKAA